MLLRAILLILVSLLYTQCTAQKYTTPATAVKKTVKHYSEALALRNTGQTQKAIAKLQQIKQDDPSFIEAPLSLAALYYEHEQISEAVDAFEYAIALDSFYAPRAIYSLGRIYLQTGEFVKARLLLQRYLQRCNPEGEHRLNAENYLEKARVAERIAAKPVAFDPEILPGPVNTESSESLPAFTLDGNYLLFTRIVNGQEDLYLASWDSVAQTWINPESMQDVNTRHNEGAHAVSGDGSIIAFTACNRNDGAGSCDIYLWERINGKWQQPRNAGGINSTGWDGHPTLTPDGRGMYFSSDRPGGIGGRDLWYTEKHDHRWTRPVNLGNIVNTTGNEEAPFLFYDGNTLYFMSDGHPGLGDHDLFFTTRTAAGWTLPQNLGFPVNTPGREGALTIHPDRQFGYFTSDRVGRQNDIYRFRLDSTLLPPPVSNLKGTVVDALVSEPLLAQVVIFDVADSVNQFQYSTDAAGHFSSAIIHGRTYGIHVSAEGYAFWSGRIVYPVTEPYGRKFVHVALMPLTQPSVPAAETAIVLRNIEFNTASASLLPSSLGELSRLLSLLRENRDLRIEIRGHTDNVGTEEDNQQLSEARAHAVYTWLINHGIAEQRLSYQGFGESSPIDSNETEEGRQQNRRTEFVIKH